MSLRCPSTRHSIMTSVLFARRIYASAVFRKSGGPDHAAFYGLPTHVCRHLTRENGPSPSATSAEWNGRRSCNSPNQSSASHEHRSSSLHWDLQETSLMCLRASPVHCPAISYSPVPPKGDRHPSDIQSLLVSIDGVLSSLTFTLSGQDSLKDVTTALRRLSASVLVLSVFEKAAKPYEAGSDDINIREPICEDVHDCGPITSSETQFSNGCDQIQVDLNQQSGLLNFAQSTDPLIDNGSAKTIPSVVRPVTRSYLYFNNVHHVPMLASVPAQSQLQSSTGNDHLVSPQGDNDQRASKEQILVMHQRLYTELPNLLKEPHDYSMYASTVEFDNRIMKYKTKGLASYKAAVQCSKHLASMMMMAPEMELLRLSAEPDQGFIQARWRIKGVPYLSYVVRPWRRKHPPRYFDALSTFELGPDGVIHRHILTKVVPMPPDKVRVPSLTSRIRIALGLNQNPALAPDCMVPKPTQS